MAKFFLSVILCLLVASSIARPQQEQKEKGKNRVFEGKISDEEHLTGENHDEHNTDYDHEAFLGDEKKTYDQLTPDESKEKLGQLVDKIDVNQDGKVSHDELEHWIKRAAKRYVYEDVDRQWNHLKKIEEAKQPILDYADGVKIDPEAPFTWEQYKNDTYGFIKDEDKEEYNYKDLIKRDQRRWQLADVNHDDKLTKEEYTAFLHPEEYEYMKGVVVEETMEDIDKDKDGFLSLEEYLGDLYPDSDRKETEDEPDWVKNERKQFAEIRDKNRDGRMDKDEVRDWIVPPDFDHVSAEATHLINEADVDQDGFLTKSEIVDRHDVFVGSQATDFGEALTRNHDEF